MLIRRCAILALLLATAGMWLGQSIAPKDRYLPSAFMGERTKSLGTNGRLAASNAVTQFAGHLVVAHLK